MITDTKNSLVMAAVFVAMGVGTVEMSGNTARAAEPMTLTMTRIQAYAANRVDAAFELVAAMPPSAPVTVPMAQKGDLLVPPGCAGMTANAQSECMDVAYEMDSTPSVVVEIRQGTTSTLLKLDPIALAGVGNELPLPSE